jgi:hypothetical protein
MLAIFKGDTEALNTAEGAVVARTKGATGAPRMGGAPVRICTRQGRGGGCVFTNGQSVLTNS